MDKIGINDFALRQTRDDFVGTKLTGNDLLIIQKICNARYIENKLEDSNYADFCKYVTINSGYDLVQYINAPIAKITEENKHLLVTQYRTRIENELPYLTRKFPKGSLKDNPSHHLLVILYSREQLEYEHSNGKGELPMGSEYDIICVNSELTEIDAPMTPDTLVRNHMGKEFGGSGVPLDKDKYMESVAYWSEHAMLEL